MSVSRREFLKALAVALLGLVVFKRVRLPKPSGVRGWWEGNTFVLEAGGKRLRLNETGGRVAEMFVGGERNPKRIARRLAEEYEVEPSVAERHVAELLLELRRLT